MIFHRGKVNITNMLKQMNEAVYFLTAGKDHQWAERLKNRGMQSNPKKMMQSWSYVWY